MNIARMIATGLLVGGAAPVSLPTPPLDELTSIVSAYSLRKLRTAYTGDCVLLRRSSDDAELAIGFSALTNWLDTTAVAAWGGEDTLYVKTWYDQSGNGLNASEADAAKQPVLVINGFYVATYKPTIRFNNSALATAAVNWGSNKLTIAALHVNPADNTGTGIVVEQGVDINSNAGFMLVRSSRALSLNCRPSTACIYTGAVKVYGTPDRTMAIWDGDLTTNEPIIYQDGVPSGSVTTNNNTTGNLPNAALFIGARNEGSVYYIGDMSEVIFFNSALGTAARESLDADQKTQWGLDFYVLPAQFADNGYTTKVKGADKKNFYRVSNGARLVYSTNANTLTVETFNDIYGSYPDFTEIGVRINGADHGTIDPSAAGAVRSTYDLGAGAKTVELITGLQASALSRIGTFIRGLSFNQSAALVAQDADPRVLVYGDSITVGANATNPSLQGWVQLVRDAYLTGSVMYEASGGRSLHDDCVDDAARVAFVARMASYSPGIIWLAIGTNDYGGTNGNVWTAANFGTAYADLLDKLHVALADAVIYAQTPILRAMESANVLGSTLGDYRTAIGTAASGKEAYCTLVDGTAAAFPQLTDLADGTHPTTAGQAKYAVAVKAVLGIA